MKRMQNWKGGWAGWRKVAELIKPVLQGSTSVTRELSLSLGSVSDRFHPDMSTGSFSRRGITKATVSQFLRHSSEINKSGILMLSLCLLKLSYYPSTSFLSALRQVPIEFMQKKLKCPNVVKHWLGFYALIFTFFLLLIFVYLHN